MRWLDSIADSMDISSVQFNSVAQSCLTLCDPMDCSMPGFPVHFTNSQSLFKLNGHESEETLGDSGGQRSLVCCSSQGCKESEMTQQLNNTSGEGINQEFGINIYTLLYLKQITNKDLLCNTGNAVQCTIITWMGKKIEKGYMYMCN